MKEFILKRSNFSFLIFYFLLALISLISIFLAEYGNGIFPTLFIKQFIFYIIGFCLIFYIQKISIFKIEKFSILFFAFTTFLLVILLFSPEWIAPTINGAKGWFNLKFLTIQPSELAKISAVCITSYLITQDFFKKSSDIVKIIQISIILLLPFILIVKENDTGNALFFVFLFLVLTFLVSSKNKTFLMIYLSLLSVTLSIISLAIYFPNILSMFGLKNYQLKRILSWIYPENFTLDFSYQITLVLKEISKGGMYGTFSKNEIYIDEQFNDFIFSVIAKNFGFIGASIFIIIYLIFIYKIIALSKKCIHGNFSYYLIILSSLSFAFSFIVNTYSSTALIPVIGINLPFISYGGSSLIANSIMFGFLMNINNVINEELISDEENYAD